MFQFCNKFSQLKLVKNQMCFFASNNCETVLKNEMHNKFLIFVKSVWSQKYDAPDQEERV